MTLIVAILSADGIIVAADGAATLGSMGASTAKQSVRKLVVQHNHIVIGVSGFVGMAQRFQNAVDHVYVQGDLKKQGNPVDAGNSIARAIRPSIESEFAAARAVKDVIGVQQAFQNCAATMVVAMVVKGKPCLMQFNEQGASEVATSDLPFIAIGSGQQLADPFLAFLRRIYHPSGLPSLNEAIFWAVWTLHHAIQTNPGGVAEPMQVVVLEKKDADYIARELDDKELHEHMENITDAEAHLRAYMTLNAQPAVAPPPVPAPVAKN